MSDSYETLPILYGRDAHGTLRNVDEVPNGKACGCTCPACGQPLNARNGGKKVIHHFAHVSGECKWSADHVVTELLLLALNEWKTLGLPAYRLGDGDSWGVRRYSGVLLPARTVVPASTELSRLSGRGAPEILVKYEDDEGLTHACAIVVSFAHGLQERQVKELRQHVNEIVLIDLFQAQKDRRQELLESEDGRHFDRAEVAQEFQNLLYLSEVLIECDAEYKYWVANKSGEQAESLHWQKAEEAEAEWRRAREEEARAKELEEAEAYNVWQWQSDILSETEHLARRGDIQALLTTADGQKSVMVLIDARDESIETINTIEEVDRHVNHLRNGADSFSVAIDVSGLQREGYLRIVDGEDRSATMSVFGYHRTRLLQLIGHIASRDFNVTVRARGNMIYLVKRAATYEGRLYTMRVR